jgi:hypothetical protein
LFGYKDNRREKRPSVALIAESDTYLAKAIVYAGLAGHQSKTRAKEHVIQEECGVNEAACSRLRPSAQSELGKGAYEQMINEGTACMLA